MVWLIVGLLCNREQRSPWRQALPEAATQAGSISIADSAGVCAVPEVPLPQLGQLHQRPTMFSLFSLPNLEVKRAVDTILLCAEDGGQVLSHGCERP